MPWCPAIITASGASTYTWTPNDGSLGATNTATVTATPVVTTTYTVTGTSAVGCSTTATFSITVDASCCGSGTANYEIWNQGDFNALGTTISGGTHFLNVSVDCQSNTTLNAADFAIAQYVTITVPVNTTLSIENGSHLYSCAGMWQGIISTGGTVVVDNSEIDDSEIALYTIDDGTVFTVSNSTFDRNFVSVDMEGHDYSSSSFTSSYFQCTSNLKTSHPASNDKTYMQFYFENAIATVGDASHQANVIQDANNGIIGYYFSELTIDNNVFLNIENYDGTPCAAVYAFDGGRIVVGNNYINYFYNCMVGSLTEVNINCSITGNSYELCPVAVRCNNNTGNSISITDNGITNCDIGIDVYDLNSGSSCEILRNEFTGATDANGTPLNTIAITVNKFSTDEVPVNINDNTINDYITGIFAIGLIGTADLPSFISNNRIYYNFDIDHTGGNLYYGIATEGCDGIEISHNVVDWVNGPTDIASYAGLVTGYYVEACLNTKVWDNYAGRNSFGFYLYAEFTNSILVCNSVNLCFPGMYLDDVTDLISQEGGCYSEENIWTGDYTNTYKVFGNYPSGNFPQIDWTHHGTSSSTYPGPWYPSVLINPIPSTCWPYIDVCTNGPPPDGTEKDQLIEKIVTDSIEYSFNESENRYKSYDYAYHSMKQDSTLITSANKSQFMQQTEQENIGLLNAINDSLAAGSINQAATINTIIVDTNLIETNKKTVNEIIIATKQNSLIATSDSTTLEGISYQDPVTGGKSIFQARAILRLRIIDGHYYSQMRTIGTNDTSITNNFCLFPNPTTGWVYIRSLSQKNLISELKVFDITGRLLINNAVRNPIFYALDLSSLKAGSYYIQINDSIGNTCIKQIVLTK